MLVRVFFLSTFVEPINAHLYMVGHRPSQAPAPFRDMVAGSKLALRALVQRGPQAVPVMGAHAVEFIRTASRRLRPRRAGGQPEELPAAFRRNRLPLY